MQEKHVLTKKAVRVSTHRIGLFFQIFYKAKTQVIQIYMLVRCPAHGDTVTVDFPDIVALQFPFLDLKDMVPAAAFQIEIVPVSFIFLQKHRTSDVRC